MLGIAFANRALGAALDPWSSLKRKYMMQISSKGIPVLKNSAFYYSVISPRKTFLCKNDSFLAVRHFSISDVCYSVISPRTAFYRK